MRMDLLSLVKDETNLEKKTYKMIDYMETRVYFLERMGSLRGYNLCNEKGEGCGVKYLALEPSFFLISPLLFSPLCS